MCLASQPVKMPRTHFVSCVKINSSNFTTKISKNGNYEMLYEWTDLYIILPVIKAIRLVLMWQTKLIMAKILKETRIYLEIAI